MRRREPPPPSPLRHQTSLVGPSSATAKPAEPVSSGVANPYYDDPTTMSPALLERCEALCITGARWQVVGVLGTVGATAVAASVAGPIAIAFGMCCCVPIVLFSERAVTRKLVFLGVSPRLAKRMTQGRSINAKS